jgi:GDP-D-mannose 3',5'-epimerase
MKRALVTGAGGFIGSHLVHYLKERGYWVRGVDVKRPEWGKSAADEFEELDLCDAETVIGGYHIAHFDEVYALAADMGGMGYISYHHAKILGDNLRINLNTLDEALSGSMGRLLFTSSACVYPEYRQLDTDIPGLKETDAWPAQPQDAYGLEKLVTEELCQHYRRDFGLQTRISLHHNVYGPKGTYKGGREKAPAAMCRKVAEAKLGQPIGYLTGPTDPVYEIDIWGDGQQTRSFLYIDDAVEGIYQLMQSDYTEPLNIGSDRMVSINQLVDIVAAAAGVDIVKRHIDGPQGVRGRSSDNTLVKAVLGWEPKVSLETGMARTYQWVEAQVLADYAEAASKVADITNDTRAAYSEAWIA